MSTKRSKRKPPAPVVTAKEQLALDQDRSLQRAYRVERRIKRTMRLLAKLQHANSLDLLSLSSAIANRAGYQLVPIPKAPAAAPPVEEHAAAGVV